MTTPYDTAWRHLRESVLARDDYRCQIRLAGCTGVATAVDHVVPLAEGGERLDPSNCRAACTSCNSARNIARRRELAEAMVRQSSLDYPGPSRRW